MPETPARGRFSSFAILMAILAAALGMLLLAYVGPPDFFPQATSVTVNDAVTADASGEEAPLLSTSGPVGPNGAGVPRMARDPNWSPFPFNPTTAEPSQKRTTAELEAAILKLADMKNTDVAHKGIDELRSSGEHAFPVLIAHLNDQTPANKCFQKAVAVPPGVVYPTIADVCWDDLHWQIMGAYPRAEPELAPFTRDSITTWLAAHAGKDLWELRIVATEEVLAAEKQNKSTGAEFLALLESRLAHIKQLAAKAKP